MAQLHRAIQTGLDDHTYNLTVLLQQASEDVVRYEAFALDAETAGEPAAAAWLRELAESDRHIVDRARLLLAARLAAAPR